MRSLTIFAAASALALAACRSEAPHGPSTFPVEIDTLARPSYVDAAGQVHEIALGATEPIEPRFRPALEALERAVTAGDDINARGVLQTLMSLAPTGGALELARAYERILDGRAAVSALSLRLESTIEKQLNGPSLAVETLVSQSTDGRTWSVMPGLSTLNVTFSSIDPKGGQTESTQAVPLDAMGSFEASSTETRLVVARFPATLPKGAMALRIVCDLELRSGSVSEGTRGLPAMRMRVATGEVVVLSADLAAKGLAAAGDLAALVEHGGGDAREALQIAVRLPRADRASALDLVAKIADSLPRDSIKILASALRWIAPEPKLGDDVDGWRAFLQSRTRERAPSDALRLPRRKNAITDGS